MEVPLDVLEARYEDDDEYVLVEPQPSPSHGPNEDVKVIEKAPGGVDNAVGASSEEEVEEEEEEGAWEEEDDYYEESEEEDVTTAALDWAEMRDGLMAKGYSGLNFNGASMRPNASSNRANTLQPRANVGTQRLDAHFNTGRQKLRMDDPMDALGSSGASSKVANAVRESVAMEGGGGGGAGSKGERGSSKDKSDRATVEQAIDPRTRMVLFKMLNRNVFNEINGCISTGKEANVYHASTSSGSELAIKIYKTSILVFKDRDRYVSGDFRFRNGYCRSNPRKMVQVWAEKEMRNLMRLRTAGINAPLPIQLRLHILVMEVGLL